MPAVPRRLALLTMEDRSGYVVDDALAISELERRGLAVEEVPWRRPVDWAQLAGAVVRTTWDYHRDLGAFLAALRAIERAGTPLANPLALVEWNATKTYLRDLEARGAPVVPTAWGTGLDAERVRRLPAELGAETAVVKPQVSANAEDTFRLRAPVGGAEAAAVAARFAGRGWLAQPFVASIADRGEASLFFFGGRYSHAVRKVPRGGDFRVQEEHGGHITPLHPEAAQRDAAEAVLARLPGPPPLQARVDLVQLEGGAQALMELELIEPALYFRTDPGAAARFADAVEAWLPGGGR